jgi:Ser-tRNA(Ala) deacylase AlaX
MTEWLFRDPYIRAFDASVVAVDGNMIVLDRTAFYAEKGGQSGDTGSIGSARVIDTRYDGDRIVHITESHSLVPGNRVHCEIDWERRHRIMRLHAASHIVYEFFTRLYGKHRVIGSHVDEKKDRMDFEYDGSVSDKLQALESNVNSFIAGGHDIRRYEDREKSGYLWWECEDMKMGCGGTHVKNTGEIGRIKLKRVNIGRGKERIETYLI